MSCIASFCPTVFRKLGAWAAVQGPKFVRESQPNCGTILLDFNRRIGATRRSPRLLLASCKSCNAPRWSRPLPSGCTPCPYIISFPPKKDPELSFLEVSKLRSSRCQSTSSANCPNSRLVSEPLGTAHLQLFPFWFCCGSKRPFRSRNILPKILNPLSI